MIARGGGAIVNVSSVQGEACQTNVAAYAASKGALNALTRAMALDHAGQRIPGHRSPGLARHPDAPRSPICSKAKRASGDAQDGRMHPLGRIAPPVQVILFLLGLGCSYGRVDGVPGWWWIVCCMIG